MLPKLSVPTYKTTLISNGQNIEYRPWLTAEHKILLMALESNSVEDVVAAVKDILKACILTKIDIDKLPGFDVQKLFLELRKKSVGEVIELKMHHPEKDHTCKHLQQVSVNLEKVETLTHPDHSKNIKIDDNIGVVMRYPNTSIIEKYGEGKKGSKVAKTFALIAACIESVYDADTMYNDFEEKEINEWVGGLNESQLRKLSDFFHTMPTLVYDLKYKCSGCGEDVEMRLEGLADFFM